MGIESDQLVYDYLSRVGDLAQQQQLSSAARMRLVSSLRSEIDRQRGTAGADSPAAVRRIIGRLGSPDELVAAAAESGDGTVPPPSAPSGAGAGGTSRRSVPGPRSGLLRKEPGAPKEPAEPGERADTPRPGKPKAGFGWGASRRAAGAAPRGGQRPADTDTDTGTGTGADGGAGAEAGTRASRAARGGGASVPRPAPARDDDGPAAGDDGVPVRAWPDPSAPHMLGQSQQGGSGEATDWWRLEPGPFDEGTAVPGFFGGIEAPELLGRRPGPGGKDPAGAEGDEPVGAEAEDGKAEAGKTEAGAGEGSAARRRALRLVKLRRRKAAPVVAEPAVAAPGPRGGFAHPLLLLAAALLVAGVVTGSWLPLAGGWLLAYSSRALSRTEAKWAALGLPATVAAGALVWVWGRMEGRWGEPIREGAMRDVMLDAWPVVIRVAAVASALYLVWRARRRTG
ncbi:hypothetical protein ACFV2V_19555 [Streptomyces sp. NPDC059698]|uniref:hypothetical protein n=1 Tax=unclassified Streptomyces TaxID=2593676 RepID=UPI00093CE02A|nr:hypothetical protein [Streptomyces sp. CB02366]OKJ41231.1 hypothetical protein AMK24_05140 [Streptomyces sp. CB02366]